MHLGNQTPPESRGATPDAVRSQLDRILGSELFTRSARLSAFLRFVVEQTLCGQSSSLKEQVLGAQLYRNGSEFDGAADPIVRVDARRLRDKLREYYSDFPEDPVVISLPKGSYVPTFAARPRDAQDSVVGTHEPRTRRFAEFRSRSVLAAAAVVTIVGCVLTLFFLQEPRGGSARVTRMRTFPGPKGAPAISPNGKFVAFSSAGPEGVGHPDIWVKEVASDSLRRLTDTPEFAETAPAWSKDGREIAFVREGKGVLIVPQGGGPERTVSDSGTHVDWAPDGKSLLIRDNGGDGPYGIFQVLLDRPERRRLTQPAFGVGDWRFSISPDGKNLSVATCTLVSETYM
jgi:hypothetical protein